MKVKLLKHKGGLPSDAWVQIVVFMIIALPALAIATGTVSGLFTASGGAEDRDQFTTLYNQIEDECDAAFEEGSSPFSKSVTVEFNVFKEIRAGEKAIIAVEHDNTEDDRELPTKCDYSFSGMPAEAEDSNSWTFVISGADSTSNPPTINVEASP